MEDLKYTVRQFDLSDTYKPLHPTMTQLVFFSSVHRTFTKMNHMLDHKESLKRL